MMLLYPAQIRRDGDTFLILFPDIPHTHTNGHTLAEAKLHASGALQTGLAMLMEKNMDIPLPGKPPGKNSLLIGLPSAVTSAKVELYIALRSASVRKAELARRMGIHKQQVERLLDLDHTSRIEQLEAAFKALNLRLTVEIHRAA